MFAKLFLNAQIASLVNTTPVSAPMDLTLPSHHSNIDTMWLEVAARGGSITAITT